MVFPSSILPMKHWTFNHYPWLRQHGTQIVIVWHKAKSLGKSEEVIKGEFTFPGHRRSPKQPQETL